MQLATWKKNSSSHNLAYPAFLTHRLAGMGWGVGWHLASGSWGSPAGGGEPPPHSWSRRSGSQGHNDFRSKTRSLGNSRMGLSLKAHAPLCWALGSSLWPINVGTWQCWAICWRLWQVSAPSAHPLLLKCISLKREVPTQGNSPPPAASSQSVWSQAGLGSPGRPHGWYHHGAWCWGDPGNQHLALHCSWFFGICVFKLLQNLIVVA